MISSSSSLIFETNAALCQTPHLKVPKLNVAFKRGNTVSVLLILMGIKLPLCIVVTLSSNTITCLLESS